MWLPCMCGRLICNKSSKALLSEQVVLYHCLYRFDEAVQVLHLKRVWVHVVEVLKLFQQGLMVHCPACNEKLY